MRTEQKAGEVAPVWEKYAKKSPLGCQSNLALSPNTPVAQIIHKITKRYSGEYSAVPIAKRASVVLVDCNECWPVGPWHMAKTIASGVGMTTNAWLAAKGVLSLKTLWAELAHLR